MIVRMTPEEASEQIEKDLQAKEAQQELFQKRVLIIGELHTERALWANKIGQLKSFSITQHDELSNTYNEKLISLEEKIGNISKQITDFKPQSIDELENFQTRIQEQFKELDSLYGELERMNEDT